MSGKERLKLLVWSIVYLVGGFLLATFVVGLLGSFFLSAESEFLRVAAVESLSLLVSYGFLSWLIGSKLLKLTRADFEQLPPESSPGRRVGRFAWGTVLGVALAILALVIAVPAGHAGWSRDTGGLFSWIERVGLTGAVLLPAALAEELAFRGLPLLAISRAVGRVPAIVGLSVLFALAHWDNPGVTTLALVNIALAGVFLGLVFYTPGGLWTSTGAHIGWNLTLAGLGAAVSGFPVPMPWLDYSPGGPSWLTGGSFGPEGGVLASVCLVGGALLAGRKQKPQPPTLVPSPQPPAPSL